MSGGSSLRPGPLLIPGRIRQFVLDSPRSTLWLSIVRATSTALTGTDRAHCNAFSRGMRSGSQSPKRSRNVLICSRLLRSVLAFQRLRAVGAVRSSIQRSARSRQILAGQRSSVAPSAASKAYSCSLMRSSSLAPPSPLSLARSPT